MLPDSLRTLLHELSSRGVVLQAHGSRLRYRPRQAVDSDPELKARLRAHKQALLDALGDSSAGLKPAVPTCGLCAFMNEVEGGDWTCPNCARREPPPPTPADWDAETSDLVAWFVDEGSHVFPKDPFDLHSWARVTDPVRYRDAIFFDISLGPDGPRNRHGALLAELKRLRELFGEVTR